MMKKTHLIWRVIGESGTERIRTADLRIANASLYQLSYRPRAQPSRERLTS